MKHTIHKTVCLNLDGFKGEPSTLISLFRDKAQKQGWSIDEINSVVNEAMRLMDYDHLIETIKEYCKN